MSMYEDTGVKVLPIVRRHFLEYTGKTSPSELTEVQYAILDQAREVDLVRARLRVTARALAESLDRFLRDVTSAAYVTSPLGSAAADVPALVGELAAADKALEHLVFAVLGPDRARRVRADLVDACDASRAAQRTP